MEDDSSTGTAPPSATGSQATSRPRSTGAPTGTSTGSSVELPADAWPAYQSDRRRTGVSTDGSAPTDGVEEEWTFSAKDRTDASPVVTPDTVYVGDVTHIYAVDREDGSERWRFELGIPTGYEARDVASSCFEQGAFLVTTDTVYVGSCNGFYAVWTDDGSVRWHVEQLQTESSSIRAPKPTIVDGVVYFETRERVYGLDATTGDVRSTFTVDGATITTSPTVVDGTLYVGLDIEGGQTQRGESIGTGGVAALDLATGTERWRFDTGHDYTGTVPTVRDGLVYIDGSSSGHGPANRDHLYALDTADGSKRWQAQIGLINGSSPAVTDDLVYVGSMNESLQALAVSDGTERWRFETDDWIQSSPAVVDGVVVLGSSDQHLYGLDAEGGDVLWKHDVGHDVETAPAVLDGRIYVGDDELTALSATSR